VHGAHVTTIRDRELDPLVGSVRDTHHSAIQAGPVGDPVHVMTTADGPNSLDGT